jgi:methionine-rich copper-binding protein CopC
MNLHKINWRSVTRRLAALGVVAGFAGTAFAHVFPQTQIPGAGTTVASPAQVTITFDGPLEPAFSSLKVANAGGKQMNTARSQINPKQPDVMSVALPPLAAGHYTVQWAAVASDGHRTHGDYAFDVK